MAASCHVAYEQWAHDTSNVARSVEVSGLGRVFNPGHTGSAAAGRYARVMTPVLAECGGALNVSPHLVLQNVQKDIPAPRVCYMAHVPRQCVCIEDGRR